MIFLKYVFLFELQVINICQRRKKQGEKGTHITIYKTKTKTQRKNEIKKNANMNKVFNHLYHRLLI